MKTFFQLILLVCGIILGLHAQPPNGLVANYQLNNNAGDATPNGNNGSLMNPTSVDNRFGDANHAYDFNGTSDFIEITPSANFKPHLPVTISAWVNLDDTNPNMVFKNDYQDNVYNGVWLNIATGGTISAGYGDGGGIGPSSRRSKESVTQLQTGDWYHITAIIRGATDMDIYINGINDCGTYTGTGGVLAYSFVGQGTIGKSDNQSSSSGLQFFNGKIDNVRFYDRAVSHEEAVWLYTANENCPESLTFVSPNSDRVGYWPIANGLAPDLSFNGNDGIVHGASAEENVCLTPNNALDFDGVNDYVELQSVDPDFKPSLPVTIAAWIRLDDRNPNMVFKNDYQDNNYSGVWLNITGSGKMSAGFGDGGSIGPSNRQTKEGTTVLNLGEWYHVAAVIRSANDIDLYLNGVNDCGSYSGSGGGLSYTTSNGALGKSDNQNGSSGLQFFNGRIDEVSLFKRALASGDIYHLYAFTSCIYGCGASRLGNSSQAELEELDIKVYPNPNKGVFTVQFSDQADAQVILRDISGRIVWSQQSEVNSFEPLKISVAHLPAGIYLLTSKQNDQVATHKIVIE
ncbi:MAG: LamG-like jellyroll fold domain-containing protein [Bacteroidota bacterium]